MSSTSNIIQAYAAWPEAEIIGAPKASGGGKNRFDGEPHVIVRRNQAVLTGPHGEDLIHVAGAGTCISLFTGAGGFDLGIEQAGFVTVCQHEFNASCCETLLANRPRAFRHAALIQGDIRRTPTEMILCEAGMRVGETHLVIGGPPCQGFSTSNSNRRRGEIEGDARNDLVFSYLRVIDQAKPHFFIMENVPGLLSFNKGAYFRAFLERAYGCFYELVYGLVNAVEYGVPQFRSRFFCMGTRRDVFAIEGKLAGLPAPQCFFDNDREKIAMYSRMPLWGDELELLRHPPGIRYFPDRPILVPPHPVRSGGDDDEVKGRSKSFVEFYRKLRREEPDRIVTGLTETDPNAPRREEPLGKWGTVGEAIGDLPPLRSGLTPPRKSARKAVSA